MEHDYIPFEIQAEIMKRLPVKSLMRFRSVSKQLKSLIHSSKFIFDHHVIHQTQSRDLLLVSYNYSTSDYYYKQKYVSFIDDDDTFPHNKFSMSVPVSDIGSRIHGSSQGLLCFYDDHRKPSYSGFVKTTVLWNPIIRKSVSIDVPIFLDNKHYETVVGFGVSPLTSDPMLVKITFKCSMPIDFESILVEVYTLSSGIWRSPLSNPPSKSYIFIDNHIVIDEFIYWLAYDIFCNKFMPLIVSFDMRSEEFTEIYLPDRLTSSTGYLSIYKLRESLVVAETGLFDFKISVWMIKNGDLNFCTLVFTIDIPNPSAIPILGFKKSGEPIIQMKDKEGPDVYGLYVYDPNSGQFNSIGIRGKFHSFFVNSYMESLLLLHEDED